MALLAQIWVVGSYLVISLATRVVEIRKIVLYSDVVYDRLVTGTVTGRSTVGVPAALRTLDRARILLQTLATPHSHSLAGYPVTSQDI